ncbi:MAG TPA: VCBS repeat-containing protein, partial [Planctomycetota bacterium]|nr:VCBS repeat-containing protein [Planctomycetota bacterium]
DVVTANLGATPGTGSITVMLGNGAGTFISAASYTVPNVNNPPGSNTANFSSIVIGDVNLDCRLDVVVSNFQGSELCVFLGNGDGSFAVPTDYQTETATNNLAQTANIVGLAGLIFDGMPAVVCLDDQTAASSAPASYVSLVPRFDQGVAIYFGSFNNATFSATTAGIEPQCVAFGDINGDGRLDMVLCNRSSNNIQVFIGDGTGNFSQPFQPIPLNQNTQPSSIVIADNLVTGAFPSVLVACQGSSQVALMRNFGGGSLASPVYMSVDGTGPTQLLVQDMNADGIPDIVTVNQFSNNVTVLLGDGTGNFIRSISSPYPVGDGPVAIASTKPSSPINFLATANFASDDVTIMLVTAQTAITGVIGQPGFVNGDVKFNTHEESLTGGIGISIAMSQPVSPSIIARGRVEPVSIAIADLNGDGAPDIVTADSFTGTLTVLHGKYQGVLTLSSTAGIVAGDTLFGPPVGEASQFAGGTAVTKSPSGVQYLYHANVLFVGPGVFTPPGYPPVTLVAGQVYVQDFFGGGAVLGGENPAITGTSADGTHRIPTAFFLGDGLSLSPGGAAITTVQGLGQLVPSGNFFKPTDYLSMDGSAVNVGNPSVVIPIGTNPTVVKTFDNNVDGFSDILVGDQQNVLSLINQAQANLQFVTVSEVNSSSNPLFLPGLLQTFFNMGPFQIFEAFGSPPTVEGGPGMVVCPAGEFTLKAADLAHYGAPAFPPSVPHNGYPINLDGTPPITGGSPAQFTQTAPGQVLSLDIGHVTLDCPPSVAVTTDGNNITVFKLK